MPKSFGKLHNEIGFKNIRTKRLVGESEELLKAARTAVRKAGPWVQPNSSQASQRWGAEASGWAQRSLSWEALVSKGNSHSLRAAVMEKRNGCKLAEARGAAEMCPQEHLARRAALLVEKAETVSTGIASGPVVLALQSDSVQSLRLAFREDLP